jgi:hypothetical protein
VKHRFKGAVQHGLAVACLETGDFDVAGEKRLIEIVLWKLAAEVAQYLGWKDSHVGAAWYEDER